MNTTEQNQIEIDKLLAALGARELGKKPKRETGMPISECGNLFQTVMEREQRNEQSKN